MTFGEAISSYFSKMFDFHGRARRSEYFYTKLFIALVEFALGLFLYQADLSIRSCVSFLIALTTLSLEVRRLHDVGVTGWFVIVPFIGLVLMPIGYVGGLIYGYGLVSYLLFNFYLIIKDSDPGINKYGSCPKVFEESEGFFWEVETRKTMDIILSISLIILFIFLKLISLYSYMLLVTLFDQSIFKILGVSTALILLFAFDFTKNRILSIVSCAGLMIFEGYLIYERFTFISLDYDSFTDYEFLFLAVLIPYLVSAIVYAFIIFMLIKAYKCKRVHDGVFIASFVVPFVLQFVLALFGNYNPEFALVYFLDGARVGFMLIPVNLMMSIVAYNRMRLACAKAEAGALNNDDIPEELD